MCCGKVCSGKSTFTRILEQEYGFYIFSADEWMLQLYDETTERNIFDTNLARCTELILKVSETIMQHNSNNNIALDFGFWKRDNRDEVKQRFCNQDFKVSLVYFPIDFDKQIQFMNKRQNIDNSKHYKFDSDTIKTLNTFFEEPNHNEIYITKDRYLETLSLQTKS